jgi:preprotein translocase subunit Sec61beta
MNTVTLRRQGCLVSSRRKKKEQGPMPAASAGLLRFFEEETEGVKIRPELLVVLSVVLIVLSVLAKVFFP